MMYNGIERLQVIIPHSSFIICLEIVYG